MQNNILSNTFIIGLVITLAFSVLLIGTAILFNVRNKDVADSSAKITDKNPLPDKYTGLDIIIKVLIGCAVVLVFFAFLAPLIYTNTSGGYNKIVYKDTGTIGDTIGGLMNPFIAIAGVIITGLAFYMQYEANKIQKKQFDDGLKHQREQFEEELIVQADLNKDQIERDKKQDLINRFESQFYEMLRIHKENVSGMYIDGYVLTDAGYSNPDIKDKIDRVINGRKIFVVINYEFESLYQISKCINLTYHCNIDLKKLFIISYYIFFSGLTIFKKSKDVDQIFDVPKLFVTELINALKLARLNHGSGTKRYLNITLDFNFKPYSGHLSILAHYYRHLFLLVKHITQQDDGFLSYEEKRKYLRIIRAQLSAHEQLLLFYNWYGEHGNNWEEKDITKRKQGKGNRFFTDFRMIHNLNPRLLISDFDLESIFNSNYRDFKEEKNRTDDYLFEHLQIESNSSE